MVIQNFSYHAPTSLEEACSLLYELGDDAKVLAGGQSLIPLMKLELVRANRVIDLKKIPNLSSISFSKESSQLEIGALTRHSEIEKSWEVRKYAPLLADTAAGIGHPLVRNRGTIGGSLCHCDPAADYSPTLLVLEAKMTLVSMGGSRRTLSVHDFILGTFETALKKGEILEKVILPTLHDSVGYSVKKLTLGHGDFPLVTVSVLLDFEIASRTFVHVAISLGGVANKAYRVKDAEKYLLEHANPSVREFEEAAKIAEDSSDPQPDVGVSAEYKKRMVRVVSKRALVEAFERSQRAGR